MADEKRSIIYIPEPHLEDPEVKDLAAAVRRRCELTERETRMDRLVDSVRAVFDSMAWIAGRDAYELPGDVGERLRAILERAEKDYAEEKPYAGGQVDNLAATE